MEWMRRTLVVPRLVVPRGISERRIAIGLGKLAAFGFAGMLWLAGFVCDNRKVIAQQATKQGSLALEPRALTIEQKAKAAMPGSEFEECARVCPVMIVVPAGRFVMGSSEHEVGRTAREGPPHEVTIAHPFAMSKFEVTFEQWDACVAAAVCPPAREAWGRGAMPLVNVSWDEAKQYLAWLSQLSGKEYRLPTEAEWEFAARARSHTRYSWGEESGTNNASCDGCGAKWFLQTAPAGSFKPNAFGLYDVHGNVWEWVEDSWHENYEGAPADGSAWLQDADPTFRVIRGGSWHNDTDLVRSAIRFKRHHKVQFDTLGFRVARTMRY